jgi:hypothetical protein
LATKIFISHASGDEALAAALVDCIMACMTLNDDDILCTSVPGHKLPLGSDFGQLLRDELRESSVVIGLLTTAAVRSGWVLFELGATWGAGKNLKPLVSRELDITALPGPLSGRHVARMSDRNDMAQFIEELTASIGARGRSSAKVSHAIDSFLDHQPQSTSPEAARADRIGHRPPMEERLRITREELRWGLELGMQLATSETLHGFLGEVSDAILKVRVEKFIEHDGVDLTLNGDADAWINSIAWHYSKTSYGKHAAIMFGLAAVRARIASNDEDETSKSEKQELALQALSIIDPAALSNKDDLLERFLARNPNNVADLMRILDDYAP